MSALSNLPKDGEELAIMKNVRFGVDDRGRVSLMFTTETVSGSAAQWEPDPEKYIQIIKDAGVSDIAKLEGKPCIVTRSPGMIHFERMKK